MATPAQVAALKREYEAAKASTHIFPDYAACEAMVESAWGATECYLQANNPFGQKQQKPPVEFSGILLPTWEVVNGHVEHIVACFVQFPDRITAYNKRMAKLEQLRDVYPEYAAALNAQDGKSFVKWVSAKWSTDPDRASKVIAIHEAHGDLFKK